MKIIVHCLVKNEERFIWYSLTSVLPFIDKVFVWDTGSTDKTISLIKQINSPKIELRSVGEVNALTHTALRDQMIRETPKGYDWLMVLDGDEIWPPESMEKVIDKLKTPKLNALGVKTINFVGDIYHRTPDSAGRYNLGGKVGHYNLRFVRLNLPKLHVAGPHGQQGYYTGDTLLQNLPKPQLQVEDDIYYFHASHLPRSRADRQTLKRSFKFKIEIGPTIPRAILPKIFFTAPASIPTVTQKASPLFWLLAVLYTLPKRIKRRFFPGRHGY